MISIYQSEIALFFLLFLDNLSKPTAKGKYTEFKSVYYNDILRLNSDMRAPKPGLLRQDLCLH
jgi:hypothetical protein